VLTAALHDARPTAVIVRMRARRMPPITGTPLRNLRRATNVEGPYPNGGALRQRAR